MRLKQFLTAASVLLASTAPFSSLTTVSATKLAQVQSPLSMEPVCETSEDQLNIAQTGAEAEAEAETEMITMILEGLKMIKRPAVICNQGNPADHKSKINVVDTHRHEYINHDHEKDGDHVTISNGKCKGKCK